MPILYRVGNSIGAQILYYSSLFTTSIGTYSSALTSSIDLRVVEPKTTEASSQSVVGASITFRTPVWSRQISIDTPVLPSVAVAVSRIPVVRRTLGVKTTPVSLTEDSVAISLNLRVVDPVTRTVDRTVNGVAGVLTESGDVYVPLGTVVITVGTGFTRLYVPLEYVRQNSVPLYVVLQSAYGGNATALQRERKGEGIRYSQAERRGDSIPDLTISKASSFRFLYVSLGCLELLIRLGQARLINTP